MAAQAQVSPPNHRMRGVHFCEPPFTRISPLSTARPLALGSILLVDLDEGGVALGDGIVAASVAPWCPIVVRLGNRPADQALIEASSALLRPPAYLTSAPAICDLEFEVLVDAVRRCHSPTSMEKTSYILERTGWNHRTADAIARCMEEGHGTPTKPGLHRSTIWRRLEKLEPLKPADWMAVSTLAHVCCNSNGSLESMALRCGWDTGTVRARSSRLVGPLFRLRYDLVGWKWILEAVLRKARYVAEAYPEGPWQISEASDSAG